MFNNALFDNVSQPSNYNFYLYLHTSSLYHTSDRQSHDTPEKQKEEEVKYYVYSFHSCTSMLKLYNYSTIRQTATRTTRRRSRKRRKWSSKRSVRRTRCCPTRRSGSATTPATTSKTWTAWVELVSMVNVYVWSLEYGHLQTTLFFFKHVCKLWLSSGDWALQGGKPSPW